MPSNTQQPNLRTIRTIGPSTATHLTDKFGNATVALEAVQHAPDWVLDNVEGIGVSTLSALQDAAIDRGIYGPERVTVSPQPTTVKKYGKTYYEVGRTPTGKTLFYSGYFQGGSYKTQITRQVWSRDRVHKYFWAFHSPSEREWITLGGKVPQQLHKDTKIADVIEDHEFAGFTDTGLIFYQRGRNYKLEHYPDTMPKDSEWRTDLELLGITDDRVAIYRLRGKDAVFPFVKTPAGKLHRLYGYTHFATDESYDLGKFGTIETFVNKLSENDQWKHVNNTVCLKDQYKEYL